MTVRNVGSNNKKAIELCDRFLSLRPHHFYGETYLIRSKKLAAISD
ncbi:hypothetical protein ACE1CD_28685 [Aerosakkonema sp. BLCC-F183]